MKMESKTYWSARSEAVKAIYEGLYELVGLLEKLSEDAITITPDNRSDAETLLAGILNLNFLVLIHFWNIILGKIDRVQKRLQDPTMNFKEAASDLESLVQELVNIRDNFSLVAIDNGKTRCTTWGIEVDRRIRRHRRIPGELARDAGLSAEEEIARVMNCVIDRLQQEISIWFLSKNLKHQILIFNKRQNSSR